MDIRVLVNAMAKELVRYLPDTDEQVSSLSVRISNAGVYVSVTSKQSAFINDRGGQNDRDNPNNQ
jgi:hypothetical protein